MQINWQVRVRNANFWLSLIPATLLLAQAIAAPFGYRWDLAGLNAQLVVIVNAAFGVLTILGIVTDPTTTGVGDSYRALNYSAPAPNADDIAKIGE